MAGVDTVCIGKPYTYTAYGMQPGYDFVWTATGGTITSAPMGSNVTVVWNTLPGSLTVKRKSLSYSFCEGPDLVKTIRENIVNPIVTGPDSVCADTYENFTDGYSNSTATYLWEVLQPTIGNVTAGTYNPTATFKANYFNTAQTVQLRVTVKSCGISASNTKTIQVVPKATLSVSGPTTMCSGDSVTYTATAGAAHYSWDFGDQGSITTDTNVIKVAFWTVDSIRHYIVSVTASGSKANCPPAGTAILPVVVNPGPKVNITTADSTHFCDSVHCTMTATVIGSGSYTYQWYITTNYTRAIPGATGSSCTATSNGFFFCVVTKSGGCKGKSNVIPITVAVHCHNCMYAPNAFSPTHSCADVSVSSTSWPTPPGGSSFYYDWSIGPKYIKSETKNATSYSATVTEAGTYDITYTRGFVNSSGDTCYGEHTETVTVPLVARWHSEYVCVPAGGYIITLSDISTQYPKTSTPPSVSWNVTDGTNTYTGTGSSFVIPSTAPAGNYTVTQQVTDASGTCIATGTITVLAAPTIGITYTPGSNCEGLPVSFSPNFTPSTWSSYVVNYSWDFGDGTYSKLSNTHRSYKYSPPTTPNARSPFLTVTDRFGCTYTSPTGTVNIWPNVLNGNVNSPYDGCGSSATLSYMSTAGSPTKYMWSNESVFNTTIVIL